MVTVMNPEMGVRCVSGAGQPFPRRGYSRVLVVNDLSATPPVTARGNRTGTVGIAPTRKTRGGYRLCPMVSSFHRRDGVTTVGVETGCIGRRRSRDIVVARGDVDAQRAGNVDRWRKWSQGESNPRYRRERPAS